MKTYLRFFLPFLVAASLVRAAETSPKAEPVPPVTDVLRVWGNPEMSALVAHWAAGFGKIHPAVRVEAHLTGSDTGIAGLYTSQADVALLGRSPTLIELQAFEWIFRYKPAQVEIMTGSLDRAGKSPALVLFVHRDNPLARLTLPQLDAIFGTGHRLGPAEIRTWGQLGLTGEWTEQPIRLYAPDAMSGTGRFFRHVVLNDSRMMNWGQLAEFKDSGGTAHDAGRQIIAALAQDRYGLAVASLGFPDDRIKALALSTNDTATPVAATTENLANRLYPLSRAVLACFNRQPGTPVDPVVRDFLRYILGREGQQAVAGESGYLPLAATLTAEQLKKLEY